MAEHLIIRIPISEADMLVKLFGTDTPSVGTAFKHEGLSGRLEGMAPRPGLSRREIILTIALNLATGIPASVVANWIYDHLTHGNHAVVIADDPVAKVSREEILGAVTKSATLP